MKILVLEDDPLLQIDLAEMLETMGHEVIGPFGAEAPAMRSCDAALPDMAFVDFNLGQDRDSARFARRLLEDGVTFAFLTAHGRQHLPPDLHAIRVIEKPYSESDLQRFLSADAG